MADVPLRVERKTSVLHALLVTVPKIAFLLTNGGRGDRHFSTAPLGFDTHTGGVWLGRFRAMEWLKQSLVQASPATATRPMSANRCTRRIAGKPLLHGYRTRGLAN